MKPRQVKEETSSVHLRASVAAAAVEISVFHPVDTGIKRLQVNNTAIYNPALSLQANQQKVAQVLFREAADKGIFSKVLSMYPGVGWASVYKIFQRGYKFTAQPALEARMKGSLGQNFFGNHSHWMMPGVSGSVVGMGEVMLLPLDILKIRAQAGEKSTKKMGDTASKPAGSTVNKLADRTVSQPNKSYTGLYNGLGVTTARNGIGSFALFSVPEMVLHDVMGVNKKQATTKQKLASEISGSTACITVSSPLDVIKTRTQAETSNAASEGFFKTASKIMRVEGPAAFFKGITPKLAGQGVKLTAFLRVKSMVVDYLTQDEPDSSPSPSVTRRPG